MSNLLLILRFCALSHASRNSTLNFMWRPNTFIALLKTDCHSNAIANSKSTPSCPYTALWICQSDFNIESIVLPPTNLDCPERFRIRMATFHSSIDKFRPNVQEILLLSTKHIDSLSTSYFAVKVVFLCNLANSNQPIRCNFAACNARNNGKCSIPLYICKKFVVCILEITDWLIQNMAVIHTCKNRPDSWFAQLASNRVWDISYCLHNIRKRFQLPNGHNIVEIGP